MYDDIFNQKFITVNTEMFGRPSITDYIREEFDKICGNYRINYDPNLSGFGILNKKETNKMEAKKCDRCGKLYEMPGAGENNGADVRFKFIHVHGSEDMSGKKIVERQTRRIWVKAEYDGDVDLCPDCRASLKKWFEGADKEDKKNV